MLEKMLIPLASVRVCISGHRNSGKETGIAVWLIEAFGDFTRINEVVYL